MISLKGLIPKNWKLYMSSSMLGSLIMTRAACVSTVFILAVSVGVPWPPRLLILQYNIAIASIADTFFSIAIGIAILF